MAVYSDEDRLAAVENLLCAWIVFRLQDDLEPDARADRFADFARSRARDWEAREPSKFAMAVLVDRIVELARDM